MKTLFPSDQQGDTTTKGESFLANSGVNNAIQLDTLWAMITERLRPLLDPIEYSTWIAPVILAPANAASSSNHINLEVPNLVFYQEFTEVYLDKIDMIKNSLGYEYLDLQVQVRGSENPKVNEILSESIEYTNTQIPTVNDPNHQIKTGHNPQSSHLHGRSLGTKLGERTETGRLPIQSPQIERQNSGSFSKSLDKTPSHIDADYNFESFVRGPSNQFAVASCQNVAENPGKNYNPLFIYGHTGLGKTHLMHAVGNTVLNIKPDAVVTYVRSENFMNEMIYCIRHNKTWDFRQKYRNCDVLLVDDIQFISGKKATQEEFFHTFNSLYEAKKQIVITSDMFPQDIPDIEERLRNRFQWGLIADIQTPDVEHRMAILFNKAEKLGINLGEDVAEYIAVHAKRNVRELEGALHRIHAFSTLHGRSIDMQLATETFQHVLGEPPKRLTIETIQKTVADHFKLRISDLKSKRRQRALTLPRQIAMYLSRNLTKSSFPEIGTAFGGKDHTTVMHAVKKIKADRLRDLDLKAHIESLERHLEQMQ